MNVVVPQVIQVFPVNTLPARIVEIVFRVGAAAIGFISLPFCTGALPWHTSLKRYLLNNRTLTIRDIAVVNRVEAL